jgi:hypothetical protein
LRRRIHTLDDALFLLIPKNSRFGRSRKARFVAAAGLSPLADGGFGHFTGPQRFPVPLRGSLLAPRFASGAHGKADASGQGASAAIGARIAFDNARRPHHEALGSRVAISIQP